MDEINQPQPSLRKTIIISKGRFKRVVIALGIIIIVLAVGSFLLQYIEPGTFGITGEKSFSKGVVPSIPGMMSNNEYDTSPKFDSGNEIYPDYYNQPTISDTREFLKTNYLAEIKTRKVSEVIKDIKSAINNVDGRTDNFRSSEKSGHIGFVVAKSKFEEFRSEIENITHEKLYTENISSDNLLSQKQGIEKQTTNAEKTLENLIKQKEDLNVKHTQTINFINKEIASIKTQLATVRKSISTETDAQILISLRSQETSLIQRETIQNKNLSDENKNYSTQIQNIENQIKNANNNLTNVQNKDNQFMDNIETVNGYINIRWISLWELATIFSPISPFLIIIILVIIGLIYLRRKKHIPRIVWQ